MREWILSVTVLVIFGILATGSTDTSELDDSTPATPSERRSSSGSGANTPQLELLSYNCTKEYSFAKITGEVKNISSHPLEDVVAVGTLRTDDGTFVKSDDALIDYNPVMPGQTSPFEVIMSDNPAGTKCQVEFKELLGGTIPTRR